MAAVEPVNNDTHFEQLLRDFLRKRYPDHTDKENNEIIERLSIYEYLFLEYHAKQLFDMIAIPNMSKLFTNTDFLAVRIIQRTLRATSAINSGYNINNSDKPSFGKEFIDTFIPDTLKKLYKTTHKGIDPLKNLNKNIASYIHTKVSELKSQDKAYANQLALMKAEENAQRNRERNRKNRNRTQKQSHVRTSRSLSPKRNTNKTHRRSRSH